MRLPIWNCSMALHRKFNAMLRLRPDVAVICECAEPPWLSKAGSRALSSDREWIGRNPNKGLAVFAFNGYALRLADPFYPGLRSL